MSDLDVSGLLTVQQAIRVLDAIVVEPRTTRVSLAAADGFRLAAALPADRDYPPFNKSQMDGFAVRRADVLKLPADLRLVGEIPAGRWPDRGIGPGETMAIMTGAPLPEGAEGVIPVEDAQKPDEHSVRILTSGGDPARFVASKGSECAAGQVVLPKGTQLGPAQIALAASIGATELEVFARPRVAVLATGDELVAADQEPAPSQIRNSNTPMLLSLLRRLGCEVSDLGTVADEPEATRKSLKNGLTFDALFVTGGMSMGEYDYVPRILQELGVDLKITKLRIKPGKPFVFGVAARQDATQQEPPGSAPSSSSFPASPRPRVPASSFVFGLPGNPVSGFVCTVRLASRLLDRMAGGTIDERWLTGKLDTGLPANGPREFYQPAIRTAAPGRDSSHAEFATITPLKWKGSADLITLAQANVVLVRPENDPTLPMGTVIRVLEI